MKQTSKRNKNNFKYKTKKLTYNIKDRTIMSREQTVTIVKAIKIGETRTKDGGVTTNKIHTQIKYKIYANAVILP
jgi:hypothetical protein